MNTDPTQAPAVAGPVELPVRPCAWTLQAELDARETTCSAHLWFSNPVNSAWAPLYDQAALDAAVEQANARQNAAWKLMCERMVAAERERCAKLCEPTEPRPCDCERCDCGNATDARMVAEWDEAAALTRRIRGA